MDIEEAFNHTSRGVISDALRRQLEVTKGTTVRGDVSSGCPQGGVMSPLLWCLVVDNLLTNLSEEGCQVVGYADDTLMELTQGDLRIVEAWCRSTGLGVVTSGFP